MTAVTALSLSAFLLARIAEDEQAAKDCAEMFPSPWDVADRGWRVRIYAGDVPTPDLSVDDEDAMTVRNPVVMEVEPDRHIEDPRWLSERVEHVRRHDPARVLAECAAKRRIVESVEFTMRRGTNGLGPGVLRHLASVYRDHEDFDESWTQ